MKYQISALVKLHSIYHYFHLINKKFEIQVPVNKANDATEPITLFYVFLC
jgi:hypothetical protein